MSAPAGAEGRPRKTDDRVRSTAEWVSLASSAAVVLALLGTIAYLHFTTPDTPAAVEVRAHPEAGWRAAGRYYVPVDVVNIGHQTAADVRVRVSLPDAGGQTEAVEMEIAFLAGQATERGVAVFSRDPAGQALRSEVLGYLEP